MLIGAKRTQLGACGGAGCTMRPIAGDNVDRINLLPLDHLNQSQDALRFYPGLLQATMGKIKINA
jgi:hypothetical protein